MAGRRTSYEVGLLRRGYKLDDDAEIPDKDTRRQFGGIRVAKRNQISTPAIWTNGYFINSVSSGKLEIGDFCPGLQPPLLLDLTVHRLHPLPRPEIAVLRPLQTHEHRDHPLSLPLGILLSRQCHESHDTLVWLLLSPLPIQPYVPRRGLSFTTLMPVMLGEVVFPFYLLGGRHRWRGCRLRIHPLNHR
jgi:hypothetical protein